MSKFIDTHPMNPFTEEQLRGLQNAPEDEFGVTHHDVLFSEEANKIWCVLNAPDEEAIRRHHKKAGLECEWIQEIKSTRE
ncbi:DUF4242 domain-containing protein [Acidobacteria bacterium AH-259-A15]|nr:DUF4242 domain-containing protein [Acidobacteria bacterium AH-259-A15]